jgi:hypothetical protein
MPEQAARKKKWSIRNAALWGLGVTAAVLATSIATSDPDTMRWLNAYDDELFVWHWAGYILIIPILFAAVASIRNLFVKDSD